MNAVLKHTPLTIAEASSTSLTGKNDIQPSPRNVTIPLRGSSTAILAVVVSLIFIFTISFAFIGADVDEQYFELLLKKTADTTPGIVLIGENVDVDVDEPSITIRWSILTCGGEFLPGSAGIHGSKSCGLPAHPLYVFVDNDPTPAATYDPSQIPFSRDTGSRRSIQNLVQFDSDHVLDVHEARLYPFDTYVLSSTIRAVSFNNETIPIRKLVTIETTSSFDIETVDMESYSTLANNTQAASRDIDLRVRRPAVARLITLFLFALSWILAHATIGLIIVARRSYGMKPIIKHLVFAGAILLIIPQLRNSMPDAPGLDGVLIDSIGFHPQMIITGISTLILLLILIGRELDSFNHSIQKDQPPPPSPIPPPSLPSIRRSRPPPSPTAHSSSLEISQYDMHRLMKHLQGQYVFPPVEISRSKSPSGQVPAHRKSKTLSRVMEAEEGSRWSAWGE